MKNILDRYAVCAVVAASLLVFALPAACQEKGETVAGFLSPVTGREVIAGSAPVRVNLLAKTLESRDTLDPC